METKNQKNNQRGKPTKNIIELIDALPEEIAKAMFRNADKRLEEKKRIKSKRK